MQIRIFSSYLKNT